MQPPHWHGAPDWQPQPQPEPQPQAPSTGSRVRSRGASAGEPVVMMGDSAMGGPSLAGRASSLRPPLHAHQDRRINGARKPRASVRR
ncbi:hypothetical protein GCM10017667_21570 [Streptomyces filamentosus]|uniref:Uncharacterized protein n=1 Tax=Streptomyces filamentosus TaxID=67294 RepID=A0A919EJL3_STRFL|nr:hypothetical protein GCM10017667_21570 [Streptomyces filamentosus]